MTEWFYRDAQGRAKCAHRHHVLRGPGHPKGDQLTGRLETMRKADCARYGLPYPSPPDEPRTASAEAPTEAAPTGNPVFDAIPDPTRSYDGPREPGGPSPEPDQPGPEDGPAVEVLDGMPDPSGEAPPRGDFDPEVCQFAAELYLGAIVALIRAKSGHPVSGASPVDVVSMGKAIKMVADRRLPAEVSGFDDILMFSLVSAGFVRKRVAELHAEQARREAAAGPS